jgi:hypothetical protein
MKIIKGVIFILCLLLMACGSDKQELRIPENEMVEILADVVFSDAINKDGVANDIFNRVDTIDFTSWAWESRGYTKAEFDSTLKKYSANPRKLTALYQQVIHKLSVESENFDESKASDSTLLSNKTEIRVHKGNVPSSTQIIYPITEVGRYSFRATVRVENSDRSKSPEFVCISILIPNWMEMKPKVSLEYI